MEQMILEPLAAAPPLSCAQLNAIYAGAARLDHELGRMVEFTVIAPGVADTIAAVEIRDINLRRGTVLLPWSGGALHEVALGGRAMDVIEQIVGDRRSGPLLADAYGEPIVADGDASDLAVEMLANIAADTCAFAWSLSSIRCSTFRHMAMGGVSE